MTVSLQELTVTCSAMQGAWICETVDWYDGASTAAHVSHVEAGTSPSWTSDAAAALGQPDNRHQWP